MYEGYTMYKEVAPCHEKTTTNAAAKNRTV